MRPELIALCYGSLVQYLADFYFKKETPMKHPAIKKKRR